MLACPSQRPVALGTQEVRGEALAAAGTGPAGIFSASPAIGPVSLSPSSSSLGTRRSREAL